MAAEWRRKRGKNNNNDDDINVLHMKAFIINLCAAVVVVVVALRNSMLVYGHSNSFCEKNYYWFFDGRGENWNGD